MTVSNMLPPSFALAVVRSKGFIASKEQQNEEVLRTEVQSRRNLRTKLGPYHTEFQ